MAEKRTHKIVSASGGGTRRTGSVQHNVRPAPEKGSAGGLRFGAVILWLAAIAFEVIAALILFGKLSFRFMPVMYQLILFIVLDLICLIIGSLLWKRSNRIDPASERNRTKFWLWNNLGFLVAIIAFLPLVVLLLTNKDLDKRTKLICTVVAAIALLIGGAASIDYDPVSQEQLDDAMLVFGDTEVYWAPFGKVYHLDEDCQALARSETLTVGTVDEAIAANRTRLCAFCASNHNVTEVVTDDAA